MTSYKDPPTLWYLFEFGDNEKHLPLRLRQGTDFKSLTIVDGLSNDGNLHIRMSFTKNPDGTYTQTRFGGETVDSAKGVLGEIKVQKLLEPNIVTQKEVLEIISAHRRWNREEKVNPDVWINGDPKLSIPDSDIFFKKLLENNGVDIESGSMKTVIPSSGSNSLKFSRPRA